MKKIFLYSSIALAAFTSSCREMDDNISPNNVLPEKISPRQMLAAAENYVFSTQAGTLNSLSNIWTNTWAGNYYYFGNPLTVQYSLDITNTFSTGIWTSSYVAGANLTNIIDNGSKSNLPLHTAIARILKSYTMQYVVDFYGDVPYSEAFKRQDNLTPKYDNDTEIYKNLVLEINKAIEEIENNPVNGDNKVTSTEDVIFGGDMTKWKLFAKNIKLKLLLRQSKVTDPSTKSFVDAQLATLATSNINDFFLGNVTINPGYSNNNASTSNPMFTNYGAVNYTGQSLNTNGWRLYKVSEYYANNVNGTAFGSNTIDWRGIVQFRKPSAANTLAAPTTVTGIKQGAPKPATGTEWTVSYLGWKFINTNADIYGMLAYGDTDSGANLAREAAAMDGYLALGSENKLLLAEAAVLYPSLFTFNAKSMYDSAIDDSFDFYAKDYFTAASGTFSPANFATIKTNYKNNLDSKPVGWSGASDKIKAIQYQRLIALASIRQVETYINYLKTGYPEIPLAENATQANKPYRLIYPSSEYIGNSNNVPNVTPAQAFTKNSTTPFWNQ